MIKYLLFIALATFVWWLFRKPESSRTTHPPPIHPRAERMVRCAYCGINQPLSESLLADDGQYYCNQTHQRAAEKQTENNLDL